MSIRTRALTIAGVAAVASFALVGCAGGSTEPAASGGTEDLGSISVGATATPAGELLQHLIDSGQAEEAGLDIEIQIYSDYVTPNQALSDGTNDANLFQHGPFLELFNEQSGDDLVNVGQVYLPPLALYSEDYTSVDDLPEGATIALPNDASNEGRALLLLAAEGLIETTDAPTTIADITSNPNDFEFSEVDAASLPQALQERDAAIVNFNFAFAAGLDSSLQSLTEGTDSSYYNVLATRAELEDDARVTTLYSLLTSDETKAWIEENYGGLVVPVE
jgi:D-methionine transport system substrate-binding protein